MKTERRKDHSHYRPKLLFLARPFPPLQVIGCVRTWNMAKYLSRAGWDVTVVSPRPEMWKNLESVENTRLALEKEGIRQILTNHHWQCLVTGSKKYTNQGMGWVIGGMCRRLARSFGIDNGIGWAKAVERACATLTPKDVDIILATGSPFTAFRVAKRLSERLGRPYVMDYRDLWTGNLHATGPSRQATVREEEQLLQGSAAVTIVSRSWGLDLNTRYGVGKKLHVVTNGYEEENLEGVQPYRFDHFAIVYTGTFYPPKRVISPLMLSFKRLKEKLSGLHQPRWNFHYYGNDSQHVHDEARRWGVMDKVVLHGKVSRDEALSAVKGAGVAVVITSVSENVTLADKGMIPAKAYEALGLGTRILVIAPSGSDIEGVFQETDKARCFDGMNIEGMTQYLTGLMNRQDCEVCPSETFAWTTIGKKMDTILRTAMSPL